MSHRSSNFAGVDVGTNSLLLTIAKTGAQEQLEVLEERCVVTRLGQGLKEQGSLAAEAVSRTLEVLRQFGEAIDQHQAIARAVGTSALRRAATSPGTTDFLEAARGALGVDLEVLSGAEEARLSYMGALSGLEDQNQTLRPVVVDPGGGSTEVFFDGDLERTLSLETGAVRLTERFFRDNDPPTRHDIEALLRLVRSLTALISPSQGRAVVAVGGTATTLAALALDLESYDRDKVHGTILSLEEIRGLGARLSSMPLARRSMIPSLPSGRADIIVAGALLLGEVIAALNATSVTVSDRGLRYGLIDDLIRRFG